MFENYLLISKITPQTLDQYWLTLVCTVMNTQGRAGNLVGITIPIPCLLPSPPGPLGPIVTPSAQRQNRRMPNHIKILNKKMTIYQIFTSLSAVLKKSTNKIFFNSHDCRFLHLGRCFEAWKPAEKAKKLNRT